MSAGDAALRGFLDHNAESERLKLLDVSAHGPLGVSPIKVIGTTFSVTDCVTHHVEGDFQDLVTSRDDCLLVPAVRLNPTTLSLQRRAILARRGQSRLDERGTKIAIAVSCFPTAPFTCALILAWAHRGPATKVLAFERETDARGKLTG